MLLSFGVARQAGQEDRRIQGGWQSRWMPARAAERSRGAAAAAMLVLVFALLGLNTRLLCADADGYSSFWPARAAVVVALLTLRAAARLGGEEVAMLRPRDLGGAELDAVCTAILRAAQVPYATGAETVLVTVSIGAATLRLTRHDPDSVVREADLAL
jgi:hypothetical protein